MLESQIDMKAPMLILASNSPRRQQLIQLLGLPYEVHPVDVDESRCLSEDAESYVERLALSKANAAAAQYNGLILGVDTIVVDGKSVLGKPVDADESQAMLSALRGRQHQVYSALALIHADIKLVVLCHTAVSMRQYSDAEIAAYVASGDPMDKAGAYAIQNLDFNPVEKVVGCYASVMGLPLCHLTRTLRRLDIIAPADVPNACQETLGIHCPVYASILGYWES